MRFPVSIEARTERAGFAGLVPLLVAMGTTAIVSVVILSFIGVSPGRAIYYLYLSPFTSVFNLAEVILTYIAARVLIDYRVRINPRFLSWKGQH